MTTFFTSRLIRQRRKRPRPWIAGSRRLVHKTLIADPMGGALANPAFRSLSSTSYVSSTNTTLTVPAGTANDDILIAHIIALKAASGPVITPPAGWTQIGTTFHVADLSNNWLTVCTYWKRAAGESGSYVFTVDSGTARPQQGKVSAYSGCITTGSPVHMFSEAAGTANATDTTTGGSAFVATAPTITTTQAGCMLVDCVTCWDTIARTPTSSWTERLEIEHLYLQNLLQASAGATGSIAVTVNSGTSPWTSTLIALLPAAGTGYTLTGTAATLTKAIVKKIVADAPLSAYAVAAPATPVLLTYRRKVVVTSPGTQYGPVTPGVAVILQKAKYLVAEAATPGYALVGTDATLVKGTTLVHKTLDATTAGAYALVAPATPVQLLRGRKLDVTTASVYGPLTAGVTVNLKHGWKVVVASPGATYALVGQDATPTKALIKKVDAAPGVYGPLLGVATPIQLRKTWRLDASVPVTYTVVGAATPVVLRVSRKIDATTASSYALVAPATLVLLLRQRRLDALTGTYGPLAGTAATLRKGRGVVAAPGVYGPLAGTAATLQKNKPLVAATSSYLLTGQIATLTYRRKIIPTPVGVYAYVGTDVGLIRPTEKVMIAGIASYQLVGSSTTSILVKRKIDTSTTPQYLLIGQAATPTYRREIDAATPGAYTYTGATTTNLRHGWKIDALAKTPPYLLIGTAATLTYRRKVIPTPAGVYGPLAGQTAALRINMPLVAGALAPPYTLVPAATPAVLRINMPLAAGVASYTLTGAATTNTLRQRKIAAAALVSAYQLTGQTVALTKLANNVILAGVASYALTPAATTNLQRKLPLVAGTASYLLSGQPALTKRLRVTNAGPSPPYMLVGSSTTNILHKWKLVADPASSGSAAAFDPSALGAGVTLSNGNLTAELTGTVANNVTKATPFQSTGKYYYEFTINNTLDNSVIGIANAVTALTEYIGQVAANSLGIFNSTWLGATGGTITAPPFVIGHVYGIAVDLTAKLAWAKDITAGGNWNANGTANPVTGVNGASFSTVTGNIYPAVSLIHANDKITINFGATAYAGTLLSGYSNWATVTGYTLTGTAQTLAKGGAQQINPALYNDPDQFFTHAISIIQSINPALFEDPDQFFTHVIEFDQFITPQLFMDPDSFPQGVVFVFYGDTEVIDVPYEDRCMVLEREDREMIQPPEDRDMEVLDEETDMYASPRKRRA